MRNNRKYVLGALLVIVGILMIFGNIGFLNISWIFRLTWPMIFVAIAFFFFLAYFTRGREGAGFLVPAGIFLTIGATFFLGELFSYRLVWPGFILAPAVGLFLLYVFGSRSPGILVPVGILFTIAATSFLGEIFGFGFAFPGYILSPAVGLFLLYIAGNRQPGLLVPIFILTAIAFTFFYVFSFGRFAGLIKYVGGGALILAGIATIFKKPHARNPYDGHDYHDYHS